MEGCRFWYNRGRRLNVPSYNVDCNLTSTSFGLQCEHRIRLIDCSFRYHVPLWGLHCDPHILLFAVSFRGRNPKMHLELLEVHSFSITTA